MHYGCVNNLEIIDLGNRDQSYHLERHIDLVNTTFLPTTEISRTPRKISNKSDWNAHEWGYSDYLQFGKPETNYAFEVS